MDNVFALLILLSIIGLILGSKSPQKYVFWSSKRTRKKAIIGYLILTIVFFVAFGIVSPPNDADVASKQSDATTEKVAHQETKKESVEDNKPKKEAKKKDDQKADKKNDKKDDQKAEKKENDKNPDDADSKKVHKEDKAVEKKTEENKKKKETKPVSKATSKEKVNDNQVPVTLVKTVDGDTIKVNYNGKEENVRYLLIDTPESKKPGTCVQPFAESASNRNKELVNSGDLTLEFEKSERDKYGRLLAYVFVDGKSVQKTLLQEGLARVAYIYEPPYKYLSDYQNTENAAKSNQEGIWSQPGLVTDSGFNGCADGSSDNSSEGTEHFQNCTELKKEYPNGVPKGHPAYQSKMDRDNDGYACES